MLPSAPSAPNSPAPLIIALRCAGLENPLGLDDPAPRFSWQLQSSARGVFQSAFEIEVASAPEILASRADVWQSGRIVQSRSLDVPFEGLPLQPRQRYFWRVRVWDQAGELSAWSAVAWFETGRLQEPWNARFIGLQRPDESDAPPAVCLQRDFALAGAPVSARLYITALGIFEATLNGAPLGEERLAPGWTDYRHRLDYLVYDVGALLQDGPNCLRVTLGDGWWSGILSEPQFQLRYGRDPMLLAELIVQDSRGLQTRISTDETWLAGIDGPVRQNSLYHGETFDARLAGRPPAQNARLLEPPPVLRLEAKHCPAIRPMEWRQALVKTEPAPGVFLYDFGENITGWARLKVHAPAGTEIRLRFGEMLQADGSLYTENLRSARATDRYLCHGGGEETWEPRFTFHGFRYVEAVSQVPAATLLEVSAVIVHTALPDSGRFECSDALLNRLQRAIVRGQKGNFLDLPTDCPQRDERLGWSGDAQIFAPTACFNLPSGPLFRSWMRSMRDGARHDGALPDLAPHILLEHGNAGWGDAGIIVPWVVWQFSGDTRILEENYAAMEAHMAFMENTSRALIRPDTLFGDWLAVDAAQPQFGPTPKDLIGTAYFARCARLMAAIAGALGKADAQARYTALFEKIRLAFQHEYCTPAGRLLGDTQCAYLLALGFDLVAESHRPAAIARLLELIRSRAWHLTTGFLGTPLLAPVLSACGLTEVAYRLLNQTTYPSWLYPITQGATTMWERWNSWTHEKGFGDAGMNSFNHYAYGAIGQWLYSTVAGVSPAAPGFAEILLKPEPGGGLAWAHALIDSPVGPVRMRWEQTGAQAFEWRVSVPPNARARFHLPAAADALLTEAGGPLQIGPGILEIDRLPGHALITLGSGDFVFQSAPCPLAS